MLVASGPRQAMTLRHVLVVLTTIVLALGPSAIVFSCTGLSYRPISQTLGCSIADVSFHMTCVYIGMTVAAAPLGNFLKKYDVRIVATLCAMLVFAGVIGMSVFTELWQFYIAGFFIGVGEVCNLWLLIPSILGRWFKKKLGFVIGLSYAMTGVGGVVFNLLGQAVLGPELEGWRNLYALFGIICFSLSVPFTVFCLRSYPRELGLLPYGMPLAEDFEEELEETAKPWGIPASEVMRKPYYWLLLLMGVLFNFGAIMAQHFSTYVQFIAFDNYGAPITALVALTGTLEAVTMGGQALGKVSLGAIESTSVRAALGISAVAGIVGLLAMWQAAPMQSVLLLWGGGFAFGFFYPCVTVLMPYITRLMFGQLDYDTVYSRVCVAVNLAGAFAATGWALVYENFGWSTYFIVGIIMIVILYFITLITMRLGARDVHRRFEEDDYLSEESISLYW